MRQRGERTKGMEEAHPFAGYRMLKYKVEYEQVGIEEYEKKYEEQQIKYVKKKAAKFGFQLIPA